MEKIPQKKTSTFGTSRFESSYPFEADSPKVQNVLITYEEALKLRHGLERALNEIGSYNFNTTAGKRARINLSIYNRSKYMMLSLGKKSRKETKS